MQLDLILASTSPYRRELLSQLGIVFQCVSPDIDEDAIKIRIDDPFELAGLLAELKARGVARQYPDAVVIGSDQLAVLDGEVLGKPGSRDAAALQLQRLAGRTHELVTAVCVIRQSSGELRSHVDRTRLTMRSLSDDAIERYVEKDMPTDCAGSYKFESAGAALFERVETEDPTAIVGLPLLATVRMLEEFGIPVP